MRSTRRGWLLTALLSGLLATLTPSVASATPFDRDVYIRDNTSDTGAEPSAGTLYSSPDIRVCSGGGTSCSGIDPFPGTHNTVNVDLRRKRGGDGNVTGTVFVYWTAQGGAATWASDWNLIGWKTVTVPPVGVTTASIDWPAFPAGPVCLLARFISNSDPMTTPTPSGTSTNVHARNNNNIAWRNLHQVLLHWPDLRVVRWPFFIRWPDPEPWWTDLVIVQPERPFVGPGRFIVDLGPELAARWRESGLKGEGVKLIDETRAEVFGTREARLQGLAVKPGEQLRTELTFEAGPDLKGAYVVRVYQTDRQGDDAGGTEYRINTEGA